MSAPDTSPASAPTYWWSISDANGAILVSSFAEGRDGLAEQVAAYVRHAPARELLVPITSPELHRLIIRELTP